MKTLPQNFWASLPFGREVSVITHDVNGLAALSKPAGVLSHPNESKDEPRCLLMARYETEGEFFEWKASSGNPHRLWLLNRLDSATSGVILVATNEDLALAVRLHFRQKQVKKVYAAMVFGTPIPPTQMWRDLLAVEKRGGVIRTEAKGNVPSESQLRLVRAGTTEPRVSLVQLEPRTGRSHQLRVQCAKRNLPIVGDQTYGNFARNREYAKLTGNKRLFLHSFETSFAYEFKGKKFPFSARAPMPADFEV